jgi:hypothetical protein
MPEIITADQFGIDAVIGGFMTENLFRADGLERIFQIQYQLPQVSGVFGIVGIVRKQDRADLLCGNSGAVPVHKNRKQLLCFPSLEGKAAAVV